MVTKTTTTKPKKKKWFPSNTTSLNWSKDDTQNVRRINALKARKGNPLKAARALIALSNVTQDGETRRKSRADSLYFFAMYRQQKSHQGAAEKRVKR